MAADLTVVGGNVACLVAAQEAATAGARVKLMLPWRGLHPVTVTGRRVDTGPRFIAVRDANEDPVERVRARSGAATADVKRYVERTLGVALDEVDGPKMMFRDHRADDLFATNDPSCLTALLDSRELVCVQDELTHRTWRPTGTLEEASLYNHGETFTRLFVAPRAEKMYPNTWRLVDVRDRRRLQVPLIDPVVMRAALHGCVPTLPTTTRYYYPACGSFSGVAERLYELVLSNPAIEVHEYGALRGLDSTRTRIESDRGPQRIDGPLVLGVSPDEIAPLARIGDVCDLMRFDVAWFEVDREDVEPAAYVNLMDGEHDAFRASFGGIADDPSRVMVGLELAASGDAEGALTASRLLRAGANARRIGRLSSVARIAPSARNRRLVEWAQRRLADLDPIYVGLLGDIGSSSVGEHLRHGLRAAHTVEDRLMSRTPDLDLPAVASSTPIPLGSPRLETHRPETPLH